jgi:hypothetical protein
MTYNAHWLRKPKDNEELFECLSSKMWRLHNLYKIVDEYGKIVQFIPRQIQVDFLKNRHNLDLILKARQLGFSTIIQIDMLDDCLFTKNLNAGIIAQSLSDAKEIFRTKIKTPYENLPDIIKNKITSVSDSKDTLELSNGSQLQVGTSMRSSTKQRLHISEYGKICAKYPEKANEIRTGALNTIQPGQKVVIESTAEGMEGDFYETCKKAQDLQKRKIPLTQMDYKFHFYPWWLDSKYTLDEIVSIPKHLKEYFTELKLKHGIQLTDQQKYWYVKKFDTQQNEMKREFPSTPDEAFEGSLDGAYFSIQMSKAREDGRITTVPWNPKYPVHTFWDLGISKTDYGVVLFAQQIGQFWYFIDYYENSGEHFPHYAKILEDKPYVYGKHFLPHDASNKDRRQPGSVLEDAMKLLKGEIYEVPRVPAKQTAINAARLALGICFIDEINAAGLIKCLDNYKKEWNEKLGAWRDTPLHNWASHGADGFMTFAMSNLIYEGDDGDGDDGDTDGYGDDGRSSIGGY